MKKEKLIHSLNEIRDEYIEEAAEYTPAAQPAPRYGRKWIAAAACFGVVTLLGFGVWQSGLLSPDSGLLADGSESKSTNKTSSFAPISSEHTLSNEVSNDSVSENINNASPSTDNVLKGEDEITTDSQGGDSLMPTKWKGNITCVWSLSQTLSDPKNKDTVFLLRVRNNSDERIDNFVHNGKTFSEWNAEQEKIRETNGKLGSLLKEGDELCYGEALYTTGGPRGYKWAKTWYEERIAYYGEDFLNRYLGDRVFYEDRLKEDIAKGKAEYDAVCRQIDQCLDAFQKEFTKDAAAHFNRLGIPAEVLESGGVLQCKISATPTQLAAIADQDLGGYLFSVFEVSDDEGEDLGFKTYTTDTK